MSEGHTFIARHTRGCCGACDELICEGQEVFYLDGVLCHTHCDAAAPEPRRKLASLVDPLTGLDP